MPSGGASSHFSPPQRKEITIRKAFSSYTITTQMATLDLD